MSEFETQLDELLERAENINTSDMQKTGTAAGIEDKSDRNELIEIWINDVEIFYKRYLKEHPLGGRIRDQLFFRKADAFTNLLDCLKNIKKDNKFIAQMDGETMENLPKGKAMAEYDVFLSHADRDKDELVEELYNSLNVLGINIFYDRESLTWGDYWKEGILDGTKKAEFAIIVISQNFFGREWTERELNEFLNRQNSSGQKLILPILHHISISQLREKYPSIADIQAIDSKKYNSDQIALLFARQLIGRLKSR